MSNSVSHILPYPIRNARFSLPLSFRVSAGTPTDPTTPDTELSSDGGATFADCAEEITTGGSNGLGYLTLSGAETNNPLVMIAAKSANCLTTPAILHPRNLPILASGTASAGAAGTITLASSITYDITGCFVRTTGGTGGGGTGGANNQARRITAYNTSTQVATVGTNWETTPDSTTTYDILCPEGITPQLLKTLVPTTAGRTLDVSTGGEAGIDWANVGSPTTTLGLTNTTVGIVTLTGTLTTYTGNTVQTGDSYGIVNSGTHGNAAIKGYVDDIGVAGAGLTALGDTRIANLDAAVTSRMASYTQPTGFLAATFPGGTIANTTNITAGTITTVTTVTTCQTLTTYTGNTPQTGDAYAYLGTNMGLLGANLTAADDAVLAAIAALNNLSQANVRTAVGLASANLDTQLAALAGYIDTEVATILTATSAASIRSALGMGSANLDTQIATLSTSSALASLVTTVGVAGAGLTAVDDATLAAIAALNNLSLANIVTAVTTALTTALTEGYRATGATGSVRDLLYEILGGILDHSITSTTKTIRNIAGTAAKTYTLDSATTPTSITEAT